MVDDCNWGGEAHRITFAPTPLPSGRVLTALQAVGLSNLQASPIIEPLLMACAEFDITSDLRRAHFIGQLTHESDHFKTTEEYASGKLYEGRLDLGNTEPGDGPAFKGHGWIMVTGRANHMVMAKQFGVSFDDIVAWLKTNNGAARSSGYFWKSHGCNELADADNISAITMKINGGLNGFAFRRAYVSAIKAAYGIGG